MGSSLHSDHCEKIAGPALWCFILHLALSLHGTWGLAIWKGTDQVDGISRFVIIDSS